MLMTAGFCHVLVIHSLLEYRLDNFGGGRVVRLFSSSDGDLMESLWTKTFWDWKGGAIFSEIELRRKGGGGKGFSSWNGGNEISFWDGEEFDGDLLAGCVLTPVV